MQAPTPELGEVRRARILELALNEGSVRVSELSALFGVTPETIRREINRLVRQGRLTRVHGGAVLPSAAGAQELPFQSRAERQRSEKSAIATAAARLVEDGDVIALDASTTALALALELRARRPRSLVIVTNSAQLPLRVGDAEGMTVVCTGGTLRPCSLSYVGPQTLRAVEGYRVRKALLSCNGFTLADGPSEAGEAEAEVKQAICRTAEEVVLLVDHTKWGRSSLVPVCALTSLHTVVTDRLPSPEERARLQAAGVTLHLAEGALAASGAAGGAGLRPERPAPLPALGLPAREARG